jgi:hypothetical protein
VPEGEALRYPPTTSVKHLRRQFMQTRVED